jgi:hypothetical protein
MNFLKQLHESQQLARLHGMSAKAIEQAFLANYVAALVVLRMGDVNGLMNIRSKGFERLSGAMSPVDFWAHVCFKASRNDLKKYLKKEVVDELKVDTDRVIESRVKKIVDSLKKPADIQDWTEIVYTVKLLQVRFEISLPILNTILQALYKWEDAGAATRMNAAGQALRILQMADPVSPLVKNLRDMSSSKSLFGFGAVAGTVTGKISRFFKEEQLEEDDGGGAPATPDAGGAAPDTTTAGAIATLPKLLFKDGRIIKRRNRKFKIRRFKDPKMTKELGDYSHVRVS